MLLPYTPEQKPQLITDITELAEPLYEPLPYHNIQHASVDVLNGVSRLISDCRKHEVEVTWEDEAAEIAAAILHDTRFPEPLAEGTFTSKEDRSCQDAREILSLLGFNDEIIETKVVPRIKCTEPGTSAIDLGERRTRRSDIGNLGDVTIVFLSISLKLFYESKQLHTRFGTKPLPWPSFVLKQQEYLKMLLQDDLSMPYEKSSPYGCLFARIAHQNVDRLSTDAVLNGQEFCKTVGKNIFKLVPFFNPEDLLNNAA